MSRMRSDSRGRRLRRQFSDEFKDGAVRLVLEEGKTVGAVARELDLTPSALGGWVRQARAERTKGKSGLLKEEREELARLMIPPIIHRVASVPRGHAERILRVAVAPESRHVREDRRLKVLLHTSFAGQK